MAAALFAFAQEPIIDAEFEDIVQQQPTAVVLPFRFKSLPEEFQPEAKPEQPEPSDLEAALQAHATYLAGRSPRPKPRPPSKLEIADIKAGVDARMQKDLPLDLAAMALATLFLSVLICCSPGVLGGGFGRAAMVLVGGLLVANEGIGFGLRMIFRS